jgi:glycosyltransferase involved in cell wall biosynthesis
MNMLAEGLAANGMGVALIVWPIEGDLSPDRTFDLVQRPARASGGPLQRLAESMHVWRAMSRADASIYIFRGGGPQILVGTLFCRIHRRRLVFSAAIDLDFDFSRADRSRWQLAASRVALQRADLIVAQREQQAELVRDAGLGSATVIPSFAEPADVAEGDGEAFVWIGRVVDYKQPLELIRLARSLPEARFRMVLMTTDETPPALLEQVESTAKELENLELSRQIPRGELLGLIGHSVAVISTSRAEGMPNAFLEAWARGVPVVSLDYDPDDLIRKFGLGLVAGGSRERLIEVTSTLWRDRSRRAELGARGRELVRERHAPEAVGDRWAAVLRDLAAT